MDNQMTSEVGMNRTGAKMSPKDAIKSAEGSRKLTSPSVGNANALGENRIDFMIDTDPVGTVPMPGSLKGAFAALKEKIMQGDHTFMDKLGERIAFERSGTRLYEALISKHKGSQGNEDFPELSILERFHLEEYQHFLMVSEAMEELGGDATAMTPSADVAGVAGFGWIQAISDPRVTFKQSLEIILQAELVDNNCWETLVELANGVGLSKMAERFQKAKEEEDIHLQTIKQWVLEMNTNGGKVLSRQIQ